MTRDKLLTVKEAAAILGLSDSGVRRLILNRVLPAERIGGRLLVIKASDLALADSRPRAGGYRPRRE